MTDRDEAWQAQETALRNGLDSADRLLAQALREPPLTPLPDNFAASTARRAFSRDDERIEMLLQYGLLGALALVALDVAGPLLAEAPVLDQAVNPGAGMPGWFAVLLLCLALSAAPGFFGSRPH